MSYILDALKKSERERPPGTVPDLFTVHGPLPPARRRPTRAIVTVVLLLVVPALAVWAWREAGRRDDGPARPQVAASPLPRAAAPAAPAIPGKAAAPAPARAATADIAYGPDEKRSQSPVPPAQKSNGAVVSSRIPVVPAVPPARAAPAPASGHAPPTFAPTVSSFEEAPPADRRVLNLEELPAPIRAGLPKLLVSGHVWSEESALRLLSVDDRLLREGAAAAPGVILLEITPTGAVFVFKDWHFRVAVGQP